MRARSAPSWLPHVAPYVLFLGLLELERRLPGAAAAILPLKVGLPAALLVLFAARGAYPELRGGRVSLGGWLADAGVGLAVAALWTLPYTTGLLARPGPEAAFDPAMLGAGQRGLALALRGLGFAAVTPFVEELFVRSFLMRFVETLSRSGARLEVDSARDFRDLPVAHYTPWSFWVTVAWFTLSHATWEAPVACATGIVYNLWLYRRGHLGAVVRAHAVTNLALFLGVLAAAGRGVDLWYFL